MSEDNVVRLNMVTTLPTEPKVVLSAARLEEWDTVLVMGWNSNGEFDLRSNTSDVGDILLLLELTKHNLAKAAGW